LLIVRDLHQQTNVTLISTLFHHAFRQLDTVASSAA
jgi:hypothetical protein